MTVEELLKAGDLGACLDELKAQARARPADARLRVFLFQVFAFMGDWHRAMTQLNVAADMGHEYLLMAQVCRPLLNVEAYRREVFAGRKAPVVFGEPRAWVGQLVQACGHVAAGEYAAAAELREQAFNDADAVAGEINGAPFQWVADADSRLGPMLELVFEGRYCWVPMEHIRMLELSEPEDLRDLLWMPAEIVWRNGGQTVGFVPVRYAGTEDADDDALRLCRRTEWREEDDDTFVGLGQRMLATDLGEYSLLDVRTLVFEASDDEGESPDDQPAD